MILLFYDFIKCFHLVFLLFRFVRHEPGRKVEMVYTSAVGETLKSGISIAGTFFILVETPTRAKFSKDKQRNYCNYNL